MSRLPTVNDCPECRSRKRDAEGVSVFRRLGPMPPQHEQANPPRREDLEEDEDKYHRPRWCPDGFIRSQKCRVQQLHSLEEAEAKYLEMLRKARSDLAVKVHRPRRRSRALKRKNGAPSQ
jgi:hypothetical protein